MGEGIGVADRCELLRIFGSFQADGIIARSRNQDDNFEGVYEE